MSTSYSGGPNDGSFQHEDYDNARIASVVYLCVVGTCGIIANSLVVFVFWKYPKLRTAANLFILNLALCDLMLSILDSVFSIVSTKQGKWLFGHGGCVTYGFFHYFFICCTGSTLAGISVDRFFFITRPSQTRAAQMITRRKAIAMLAIIYLYTLMFTFPPCVGWNDFVVEHSLYSGCYINYGDQRTSSIVYSIIAPFFLFLVPLTIMIYCYARIFLAVRRSTRRTITRSLGSQSLKRYPLLKRTHVQTAKIIVVVILFSMIVWVPYVVVSFVKAANGKVNPLVSHITVLVAKSCVIYNVLIYAILNRKLKAAILDAVSCGRQSFSSIGSPSSGNSLQRNRANRFVSETEVSGAEGLKNRISTLPIQQGKENVHNQYTDSISLSQSAKFENGVLKSLDFENKQKSDDKEGVVPHCGFKVRVKESNCKTQADVMIATTENSFQIFGRLDGRSSGRKTNGFPSRSGKDSLAEEIIAPQDTSKNIEAESNSSSLSRNETPRAKSSNNSRLQSLSSPSQLHMKGASSPFVHSMTRHISNDSRNPRASVGKDRETNASSTVSRAYSRDTSFSHTSATTQRPTKAPSADRSNSTHISERTRNHRFINYGRNDSMDPFNTSAKELVEIQNFWKRMSLCLDDIDIGGVTREMEIV